MRTTSKHRSDRTTPSKRDLRRFAMNVSAKMNEISNQGFSLAVCFDALISVLDERFQSGEGVPKISESLKAELEKRKQMQLPQTKEPDVNP